METGYRNLDSEKIVVMIDSLHHRIVERFPESSLGKVCEHLLSVAKRTKDRTEWMSSPIYVIRVVSYVVIGCILAMVMVAVVEGVMEGMRFKGLLEVLQVSEPGVNLILLVGAGVFFLSTLENKIKRHQALKHIHELRSIAHIIDMHQLTKDPERLVSGPWPSTHSSPVMSLNRFEIGRYLDYCSEMLSAVSKLAALYVQDFDDEMTLTSVNEIESLTNGLSRKIWQKMMILHAYQQGEVVKVEKIEGPTVKPAEPSSTE